MKSSQVQASSSLLYPNYKEEKIEEIHDAGSDEESSSVSSLEEESPPKSKARKAESI